MKVLYQSQELWDIVQSRVAESFDMTNLTSYQLQELKNHKKDKKALFFIYQAVVEVIFKMKDFESIEDYFNRVVFSVNQLKMNGEEIEDQRIVEKILRTLTRKFESTIGVIEYSKDLSTLSVESLWGSSNPINSR